MTIHAARRALRYSLDQDDIEKIVREGQRIAEGKKKARYMMRTKRGVFVAICAESPDLIVVKTIVRGR